MEKIKISGEDLEAPQKNTLKFNVSFVVGEKKILTDAYGELNSGECLAIMGPSGAGKTTLLNVLTLDTRGGQSTGEVTLNGMAMSNELFKKRCNAVNQEDYHWSFLTCRETISYAAQLYLKLTPEELTNKVDEMLKSTGLEVCADIYVGNELIKGLSGGQKRRLSVAVAMLKRLDVIYLDEPTSGLDSASAANIMQFITDVTKTHNLISITTIHQPSTAVYNGFDKVMLLSKGRMAYCGNAGSDALDYFSKIGHPITTNMNPAEFMVDLVNADFHDAAIVDGVVDAWSKCEPPPTGSSIVKVHDVETELEECAFCRQLIVLLQRHGKLCVRDPLLYLGRMGIFLVATLFFAIVYVSARPTDQDQVMNRMWYIVWCIGMPANMGVIAVYAYNHEFFAVKREVKNGMVSPGSYLITMSIIQIPVMILLGVFAISVGGYGVIDFEGSHYFQVLLIYAACIYSFEAFAQLFSVMNDNPLMGMLNFMQIWFASFLFCGMMVPINDVVWPFRVFGYILPLKYALRSMVYEEFIDQNWHGAEICNPYPITADCYYYGNKLGPTDGWTCGANNEVCYGAEGWQVLDQLGISFTMISSTNKTLIDCLIMLGIALFVKIVHAYLAIQKCNAADVIIPKGAVIAK